MFEGIDAGDWKGHCEANDCDAETICDGLSENLHVRCNRGLKSEIEIKHVWMSQLAYTPSMATICSQERSKFLSKIRIYSPLPILATIPRIYALAISSYLFICLFLKDITCSFIMEFLIYHSLCLNHCPHCHLSFQKVSPHQQGKGWDRFSVLPQLLVSPFFISSTTLLPFQFPSWHWAEIMTGSLFCDQDQTLFMAFIRWPIIVGQTNEWRRSRMNGASLWSMTSKNLAPLKTS